MIKGLCHAEISGDAALLLFFFDTEVYLYHAASCHQSAVEYTGFSKTSRHGTILQQKTGKTSRKLQIFDCAKR